MVFRIKNLQCRYSDGPVVLDVPDLEIPRGEMIFMVGASGIGKSTFLEALGLMNRTIDHIKDTSTSLEFIPENGAPVQFSDIWNRPKDQLAELRNQYFSFIFQQTNLMPHFTVGENMMMSGLVAGIPLKEIEPRVRNVMMQLNLGEDLFNKRVVEVSGGQRQRLAFVRAFVAPFEVLFADEPTGNLDPVTSKMLIEILQHHLKTTRKTGILVSHDIHLALDFADRIIPILPEKNGGNSTKNGRIDPKEILVRDKGRWVKMIGGEIMTDPFKLLWNHISNQAAI